MSTTVTASSTSPNARLAPAHPRSAGDAARLTPARLADLTRFHAARCLSGDYPFVRFDAGERWHRRIYRDARVDVWLISWLPTQGTQLHDHGLSSGSFSVVEGELTEFVPAGWSDGWMSLRPITRTSGATVSFGRHHIHDVVNHSSAPAVSVHAYSPPLTSMRYYDLARGELALSSTVQTDDPEPSLPGSPSSESPTRAPESEAIRRAS